MDLYLIRHAEAADRETWEGDDEDRPLTDEGHGQARLLASGLRRHGVALDAVVASPLVRAQQTAQGLLNHWGEAKPELLTSAALSPGGRPKKLTRFLDELNAAAVGLVGHMPDLEGLAGWLIGGRKVHIDLAKAGVALIRCPDGVGKGTGQLTWMITPEWLTEPTPAANVEANSQ